APSLLACSNSREGQRRRTMDPILGHIDDSLVGYTAEGADFTQLVQETLGNAGDESDGFEAAMSAVTSLFPSMDADITHLGETADDVTMAMDAFNALDTTSWAADFIGVLPALSALPGIAQIGQVKPVSLPGLPPPPGTQPPAPPPVT